jgi:hypothetical protein
MILMTDFLKSISCESLKIFRINLFFISTAVLPIAVIGQVPDSYSCYILNDTLINAKTYQFDVFLHNTDAINQFELANLQLGLLINQNIKNGGLITPSLLDDSSGLNENQKPTSVKYDDDLSCIEIATKASPGFGNGTMIPFASGGGILICRVRLENSADFGEAKPELAFNFSQFTFSTIISAYNQSNGINIIITDPIFFTSSATNPILNGQLSVFNVTGAGNFCEGSSGLPIDMESSQQEIKYQLIKDGINNGPEVSGSGFPLVWDDNLSGIYSVSARRPGTYLQSIMNGSAVITMDSITIAGSVTGGYTIAFGQSTDSLKLINYRGEILTWQKQYNETGYSDIPSTSNLTFYSEIPDSTGSWDYRAIVKNGLCQEEASIPAKVIVLNPPITRYWIGTVSNDWKNPLNWNPSGRPSYIDNVIIPASVPYLPEVKDPGMGCNDLFIESDATIKINPGCILLINGNLSNEGQ